MRWHNTVALAQNKNKSNEISSIHKYDITFCNKNKIITGETGFYFFFKYWARVDGGGFLSFPATSVPISVLFQY